MQYLLFDKSAFQGLSEHVHALVRDAYATITSSTLLHEIAGNLQQDREFAGKTPEEQAGILARKFGDRVETHEHWETLCQESLRGESPGVGKPIIRNTVRAFTASGQSVYLNTPRADGSPVSIHKNWVERLASNTWSTRYLADTRILDTEVTGLWGQMKDFSVEIKPPRNAKVFEQQQASEREVLNEADRILSEDALQDKVLSWVTSSLNGKSDLHHRRMLDLYWEAHDRRYHAGLPKLDAFAPYAYHCARVRLLYLVGYAVWPKGRHLHDLADIEYLNLLPFTEVFASNDRMVRAMAKHLLRPDQVLTCSCKLERELTGTCKDEAKCEREHYPSP